MAKGCDVKQEKITFGEYGTEPGKFRSMSDVAVSADSEIFVTDSKTQRVQVFSIDGTLLRLFPTVLPGESKTMYARSVDLEVAPGYLWVLGTGKSSGSNEGHVVQYSKNGQPIKKWTSEVPSYGVSGISGVTSDKEGNVLLTDWNNSVYKYNASGVKIFEFGTKGDREGQLNYPLGICLDTSGRIIVANYGNNRVDMFTSQGEFVRTIADIKHPFAVAMGPCGELVGRNPDCRVAFSPGGLLVPSGVSQISAMLFTTGRVTPGAEARCKSSSARVSVYELYLRPRMIRQARF
ncbi:hypothetical protein Bbelb_037010 [Branchiostoma belcheri]|nr:hypothetical protein Bbelb_037010 [Branchiostoma belcheri]